LFLLEFAGWFDKYDWNDWNDFDQEYDYYSVMHYSAYVASFNGKPTISSRVMPFVIPHHL
jgi:hypothetical protein